MKPVWPVRVCVATMLQKTKNTKFWVFFTIPSIYTCKYKIHSHQSYIYYDMPGNKKILITKKIKLKIFLKKI